MRIAALADIHCSKHSHESLRPLFTRIADSADVVKIPALAVLGNHEFESGKQEDVKRIFPMLV